MTPTFVPLPYPGFKTPISGSLMRISLITLRRRNAYFYFSASIALAVKSSTSTTCILNEFSFFSSRNFIFTTVNFGFERQPHCFFASRASLHDHRVELMLGRKSINLPASQCKLTTTTDLIITPNYESVLPEIFSF